MIVSYMHFTCLLCFLLCLVFAYMLVCFFGPAKRIQHFIKHPQNKCWVNCWARMVTYVGSSNICKAILDEVWLR